MKAATDTDVSSAPVALTEIEVDIEGIDLSSPAPSSARTTSPANAELDTLDDVAARSASPAAPRTAAPTTASEREQQAIAARNEERNKRKQLARRAEALEQENERLRAARPATAAGLTPSLLTAETPAEKAARKQKLVDASREKDTIAEVVELVFDHFDGHVDNRLKAVDTSFTKTIDTTRMAVDEQLFKVTHDDYDELLRTAGVFDALQVLPGGLFKDPAIARRVYGSANPSAEAYAIAQEKAALAAERREQSGEPEPVVTAAAAAPRTVAADAVEAAEQRGRRQAFEQVAETANQSRGIRHLPSAGATPRRAAITKEYLDNLVEQDFAKYEALVARNPQLKVWHLSD